MNIEESEKDMLKDLLQSLPTTEEYSKSRKQAIMHEIRKESVRIQKRKERLGWLATTLASFFILLLGIKAFDFLDISFLNMPSISIFYTNISTILFSVFIGVLASVLLLLDYFLRKKYWEHK